ncbi:DJ-1/PfpI family protein [Hwanghaeella sp.]|uniref:DJ-1/PfpI family protein n=1 Tax=Hwanghaeella sp. TaxID=2605943 RepID=UPI003CCC3F63
MGMMTVGLVIFDGFTDIDLFLHWDLLNRPVTMFPDLVPGGWSVKILGTASMHVSAAGLETKTHGLIGEARGCDAVIHVSGPMTRKLMKDTEYLETLALDPARQLVGSQCSGALILAASGFLTGRTATTYPTAVGHLRDFGAVPVEEPFVLHDGDNIATAAGCLAGVDLSRWILTRLIDAEAADRCIASASAIGEGLNFPKP